MRILNVGHRDHVRVGSDTCYVSLARLLADRGHEVVPFVAASESNRPSEWSAYYPPGVDTERPGLGDALRYVWSLPARRSMRRLLGRARPDVAHLHITYGQLTASILGPLVEAGVPIVQTTHEYKLLCPAYTLVSHGAPCEACGGRRFRNVVRRRCKGSLARSLLSFVEARVSRAAGDLSRVDHFIASSDFQRAKLLEHGVLEPERVTRIHNFVECPPEPGRGPRAGRAGYVLYFGRLAPVKGVHTLIDAVAPLAARTLIVGDGPSRRELEERARTRGAHAVEFTGSRSGAELARLVAGSLCVVVPSEWYENCPLSLLEAMAAGRPVVASRIGGIPELVTHGRDGFLFEPGGVLELRERLAWLLARPHEADAMGAEARLRAGEAFGPERFHDELMAVYARVT